MSSIGMIVPVFILKKGASEGENTAVCMFAAGSMLCRAIQTAQLPAASETYKLLFTAEEHSVIGGLYGAVAECLCPLGAHKPLVPIGMQDFFAHAGSYAYQMQESGLTAEQIRDKIFSLIQDNQ